MTRACRTAEETKALLFERSKSNSKGCRLWTGAKTHGGYGKIWFQGKLWDTHRLSYVLHIGPTPEDSFVCHTCDEPSCIEPSHLWLGDQFDNMRDCARKKRNGSQRHPESRPRGVEHWTAQRRGSMPTRGEKNVHAKLTESQVRQIRKNYEKTGSVALLAKRFGVTIASAWAAATRKTWRHVL